MSKKLHLRPSLNFSMLEAIQVIAHEDTPPAVRKIVEGILARNLNTINRGSRMHAQEFDKFLKECNIEING